MGPETENIAVHYDPTREVKCNLTARIRDPLGWSNIAAAEYFVDVPGPNGNGALMAPLDGAFDSPTEDVRAQINVTEWPLGNHTIHIHGKDAKGNWGSTSEIALNVHDVLKMHVASIDVYWEWSGGKRYVRAAVTILDSDGKPVENAMVYGHWGGKITGNDAGKTDTNGRWITTRQRARDSGTYTFTVDNVVLETYVLTMDNVTHLYLNGVTYDKDANVETSDSITG